jgi:hypothetical protein
MLTASCVADSKPHEMMDARLEDLQCGGPGWRHRAPAGRRDEAPPSEELSKAHEHVRAAQWAFATSMVVNCEEWGEDGDDDDWDDDDWEDSARASHDPATPDWRGSPCHHVQLPDDASPARRTGPSRPGVALRPKTLGALKRRRHALRLSHRASLCRSIRQDRGRGCGESPEET